MNCPPFLHVCVMGLSSCLHACILRTYMKVFLFMGVFIVPDSPGRHFGVTYKLKYIERFIFFRDAYLLPQFF